MQNRRQLKQSIRRWLLFFIVALILSGVTAFALETELAWLNRVLPEDGIGLHTWITKVYLALKATNEKYPFMAYGYDWLAFAHLVIAVAFIGPYADPVKNVWIIQFGMIACVMIFPLAFAAGYIRGIPFYWQLIDCSFGVGGFICLFVCFRKIKMLAAMPSVPPTK